MGDAPDIGVLLVELMADPGALENVGVLTVDVEADVVSIGDSETAPRSWSSALVMGDAPGKLMEGMSTSVSESCGGVWGPGDKEDP